MSVLEATDDVTGGATDVVLLIVALGLLAGVLDWINQRLGTGFALSTAIRRGFETLWNILTGYDNA
jgi:hypothetical protein